MFYYKKYRIRYNYQKDNINKKQFRILKIILNIINRENLLMIC